MIRLGGAHSRDAALNGIRSENGCGYMTNWILGTVSYSMMTWEKAGVGASCGLDFDTTEMNYGCS